MHIIIILISPLPLHYGDRLCDRSKKATLRGVPELAVYGPGNINVLMAPTLPKSPFIHTLDTSAASSTPARGDRGSPDNTGGASICGGSMSSGSAGGIENRPESAIDVSDVNYENMQEFKLPQILRRMVRRIHNVYTAASSRSSANEMGLPPPPCPVINGMDSARFLKLMRDGKVLGSKFRHYDLDIVFTKHAYKRRLDYESLCKALVEVALKRDVSVDKLIISLNQRTALGPSLNGTFAEGCRLHDDKSTYTGVYKAGGPTTIDYEKMAMSQLCDRSKKASVRGTPNLMVHGPGDRYAQPSAHNLGLQEAEDYYRTHGSSHNFSPKKTFTAEDNEKYSLGKYATGSASQTKGTLGDGSSLATGFSSGGGGSALSATPIHDISSVIYVDSNNQQHLVEGHDVGLQMEDMEITYDQMELSKLVYEKYELSSRSFKDKQKVEMDKAKGVEVDIFYGANSGIDSSKFHKLCTDARLYDKYFRNLDVDIVFMKHKNAGAGMCLIFLRNKSL